MPIRKGDKAPSFELACQPGETVNLADYLGREKIVLLFFPLCYSPVCTTEMCTMRDSWDHWKNLNAKVFGLSVDSPFVTARFRADEKIPFPLLSDFNKEVTAEYGVLYEELRGFKGVSKRAAFVIGTDGLVHFAWVTDNSGDQPEYEQVRNAVAQAP